MYDKRPYLRTDSADVDVVGTYRPIGIGVERNTDPFEVLARIGPYFGRILANARSKNHGVRPVSRGGHCSYLRPKAMNIDVQRQSCCRVSMGPML